MSACDKQVKAQLNPLPSMNLPSQDRPPNRDPNLDTSGFPPPGKPPASLPLPENPSADIGEAEAVKRALKMVESKFGASSPQVISNKVMTFKEAMQLGAEPVDVVEQDPRSKMLVRVVEMKGAFNVRSVPPRVKTPPTFTKALVFLRAPDGQGFRFALSLE